MRNAPVPKGMVTALFLSIVVKKECIVNAFNILSTFIRLTTCVLPLVEFAFFPKKERQPFRIAFPFLKRDLRFKKSFIA